MGLFSSLTDTLGLTSYGDQAEQLALAQAQFAGINLPDLTPLELERMVSAGEITPQLAEIIKLEGNAYKDIYVDPKLKAQQMQSLAAMQDLSETGLSAQDKSDLAKIASQEAIAERGSRESLIQQAQMKGVSGSGLDLAAQLANQQTGATNRSARDLDVAGQASQRRIEALQQAGTMAGNMRSQEYSEQAQAAAAQQAINQFNAQNTQSQLSARAAAQNAAQQANLSNAQNIMNQNTGLTNQEIAYKAQLAQQQYQNQLNLASAKAGTNYQAANAYGQQSATNMQGAAAGAGALALAMSDKNMKKDIEMSPEEIDKFLEDITGYSFRYKDEAMKHGATPGRKIGVMAQDMEKILPRAVTEMDDGAGEKIKMLKNPELIPAVLASVGRLNDRLKKLENK